MGKMTLGQYISYHRKLKGMTQKELAEKLNVSDKAVSRWERDENAPDITLIPQIADIFEISCDELLRGERRMIVGKEVEWEENGSREIKEENEPVQKQSKNFKEVISKFTIRNLIAVGIALLCPISIKICDECNLGVGLAYTIGAIFILFGVLCEIAFYNDISAKLSTVDFDNEDDANESKFCLMKQFQNTLLIQACIIMSSMYITEGQAEFLYLTIIQIALTIIVGKIIIGVVNKKLSKKNIIKLSEKGKMGEKLKLKNALILVGILIITGVTQLNLDIVLKPTHFIDTFEIESIEDLKKHEYLHNQALKCYSKSGREISWDDTVYCWQDGELEEYDKEGLEAALPMIVCRYSDDRYGEDIIQNIHFGFMALYLIEIIVFSLYARWSYKRKISKIQ